MRFRKSSGDSSQNPFSELDSSVDENPNLVRESKRSEDKPNLATQFSKLMKMYGKPDNITGNQVQNLPMVKAG